MLHGQTCPAIAAVLQHAEHTSRAGGLLTGEVTARVLCCHRVINASLRVSKHLKDTCETGQIDLSL